MYFLSCMPWKKCIAISRRKGLVLERCVAEIGFGVATPTGRIVCTSRALVFVKNTIVLPYSAIVWMHEMVKNTNGSSLGSWWRVYTDDGSHFMLMMDETDASFILDNYGKKFREPPILGFSEENQTRYYQIVEKARAEGTDFPTAKRGVRCAKRYVRS